MIITIDDHLILELINHNHAKELYELANNNYEHISQWMPWILNMKSQDFIDQFIINTIENTKNKSEYAFVIKLDNVIIGRIGVYKIDPMNAIGEIGYWIAKPFEGNGYIIKSTYALTKFCFEDIHLNRIEIKCGEYNTRSRTIPEKLNFNQEALLKEAERIGNNFQNLYLYAMCFSDFNKAL